MLFDLARLEPKFFTEYSGSVRLKLEFFRLNPPLGGTITTKQYRKGQLFIKGPMGVDSAKGNNQKRLQQQHRILLLQQYSFAQTKKVLFDFPRDKSAFILRLVR